MIPLWELLCYGAFCVAGGIFCGWIIWKAPERRARKDKEWRERW